MKTHNYEHCSGGGEEFTTIDTELLLMKLFQENQRIRLENVEKGFVYKKRQ